MRSSSDQPKQPSMQDILRIAQSSEGQKIISMLKNQSDPRIKQAMENASQGNYSQAKELLGSVLSHEELQRLINALGGI